MRTQEGQGQKCRYPKCCALLTACQERGSLGMSGPGVVSVAVGLGGRLDAEASGEVIGGDVEGG